MDNLDTLYLIGFVNSLIVLGEGGVRGREYTFQLLGTLEEYRRKLEKEAAVP